MESLKRKREEPAEGTAADPIVLDKSDDANALARCQKDDSVAEPPIKKRKIGTHICIDGNAEGVFYRSTTSSKLDEPGFPEDAWGKDRAVISEAISDLAFSIRNQTQDGSVLRLVESLQYLASDAREHPGRSPAYKRAQFKIQGQSKLLQLPREIRDSIWQLANPLKLDCFFAGLKVHEVKGSISSLDDWRIAFTHLSNGRGLPVSRQIWQESQAVAQPIGSLCCSQDCLMRAQILLGYCGGCDQKSRQDVTIIRQWASIRRVEVPTAEVDDADCHGFCCWASGLHDWVPRGDGRLCWTYRTEDKHYIFEKICRHSACAEEI